MLYLMNNSATMKFNFFPRVTIFAAAAVAICSAGGAFAQKGPFMDGVIAAADAKVGQSLWAVGYHILCPTLRSGGPECWEDRIRPLDQVTVEGFATDPSTGIGYVRLKKAKNGAVGLMEANWRTWVKEDPKHAKCREGMSLQIGWSDDMVLRALGCAPDHINSTVMADGTKEQWVYGVGNYLYFDEQGSLVAMQLRGH
jgi:hypothetical protein